VIVANSGVVRDGWTKNGFQVGNGSGDVADGLVC
jgi:hypothetical protein